MPVSPNSSNSSAKLKGTVTAAFLLVLLAAVLPFFFSGSISDLSRLQTAMAVSDEANVLNGDGSGNSLTEIRRLQISLQPQPDTVALGDTLLLVVTISPSPPTRNDHFSNLTLIVHRPDGTTELLDLFESDSNGSQTVAYKPEMIGNYATRATFAGQTFASQNVTYLGAESSAVTFNVSSGEVPIPPVSLTPSATLFVAGAKWAAGNGSSALYINWLDNYEAHHSSDGIAWGPYSTKDRLASTKKSTVEALEQKGFTVTCEADMPNDISSYDLIVFEAYYAVEPAHVSIVRDYLTKGGSVVLTGGVPCYFSTYCRDMWPYITGGQNLASLQDWFGSACYVNSGGMAYLVVDNPFGTSLPSQSKVFFQDGYSAAGVTSVRNSAQVVATWNDGTVFAFTNEYAGGRVYYQASIDW